MRNILLIAVAFVTITPVSAQWVRIKTLCDTYDSKMGYYLTDSIHYFNTDILADSLYGYTTMNQGQSWDLAYREVYTYDSNGYRASVTIFFWNGDSFMPYLQTTYVNDAEGRVLEETQLSFAGTWQNILLIENEYDTNGFLAVSTEYYWYVSEWIENTQSEFVNGPDGPQSHTQSYYYEGEWITEFTATYYYTDGVVTFIESMDPMDEPLWTRELGYDENGNVVHDVLSDWHPEYMAWLYSEDFMEYDANGNLVNEHGGHLDYSGGGTTYYYHEDCDHYYEFVVSGVNEQERPSLQLYPNPASEQVFIRLPNGVSEIFLYDLAGRLILCETTTSGFYALPTGDIPTGSYILRMQHGAQSATAPLTVAH